MAFGDSLLQAQQLGDQRNAQGYANLMGGLQTVGNYFGSIRDRQQALADNKWKNFQDLKNKYPDESDTQIEQRLNEQEALRARFQNEQKSGLQKFFDRLRGRSNPHFDESIRVAEREDDKKFNEGVQARYNALPDPESM